MSRRCSVADAKNHLPALIHDVESGQAIEITRRGEPVAVLLSFAEYQRSRVGRPDFWSALQHFRESHDLDQPDAEGAFAGLRDPESGRDFEW